MNSGAALNAEKIHSLIKLGNKTELLHLLMARAEVCESKFLSSAINWLMSLNECLKKRFL